jgi:hypothetical protein
MFTTASTTEGGLNETAITPKNTVALGDRVRLISGQLSGLEGVVLRCEEQNGYVIGIPDPDSHIMVRVHGRRLQRLQS